MNNAVVINMYKFPTYIGKIILVIESCIVHLKSAMQKQFLSQTHLNFSIYTKCWESRNPNSHIRCIWVFSIYTKCWEGRNPNSHILRLKILILGMDDPRWITMLLSQSWRGATWLYGQTISATIQFSGPYCETGNMRAS